ncbi:recombinase family protein [Microbacterium sp. CGR1]|uniref:recombinase family protein n=1 Tax=Microbacterium sp. CGR1 TaxID=1696072 RepID=UPI003DA6121C
MGRSADAESQDEESRVDGEEHREREDQEHERAYTAANILVRKGSSMRAAIYTRISEDKDGDELGVERQEQDCRRLAAAKGWEVVQVFEENDTSAYRSKVRPKYQAMTEAVRAGDVQAIVVWDVDRLSRTPRELEDVIDFADSHGLALASVGGEVDLATPQGRLTARIKGSVARHESEQMARRLRRRLEQKAESGEPHGRVPYGFVRIPADKAGKRAARDVVNPDEAAVLREVANGLLSGGSLRRIAAALNESGVPSPESARLARVAARSGGGEVRVVPWSAASLRQAVRRPQNAGKREFRGRIIGDTNGERIFDDATWERLCALLDDPARRSNKGGAEFRHLLSGVAKCGRCDGTMRRQTGSVRTLANGEKRRQDATYFCVECYRVRRRQAPVDAMVETMVLALLQDPRTIQLHALGDADAADEARADIERIDAKLAIAADQFADDTITGEQLQRITGRLRSDRERLARRIRDATPTPLQGFLAAGDVAERWHAAPVEVRRELVDMLVTVTIMPSGSGRKFDPELVRVERRVAA